jgi:hypothetical protein
MSAMSERGADFMNEWLSEKVVVPNEIRPDAPLVKALAAQCEAAVGRTGITREEIEEDMGYLEDCILQALIEGPTRSTGSSSN